MQVPLMAFLVPFSPELWIAIFISLNVTALAVAIYEWLSPFGLNPWGRQRSKNFSYGSALWVTWGLLFSHLVAFKAPKSWPNKVLINVWGAFSVIFVASYTANIAALFAGLFIMRDGHEKSIYALHTGAIRNSATEFYLSHSDPSLWAHVKNYLVDGYPQALQSLHNGRLDLLVGDSAILDYMRANDPGCTLEAFGSDIVDDTFAVAMPKGFPLKMQINSAISQYVSSGHLEYLRHKWYGKTPCFRLTADIYKPQPLEIETVAGVFIMLTLGILIGLIILVIEHLVYKYALPGLRTKPKDSVWRNRNLMFFSQKLYRFINCVELVSPHHSAKELVNNIRTGQIMGLFQKSVKRKENEQKRRRKSKAQFFEMIQEIRRVQKEEKSVEAISSSVEIIEMTSDSDKGGTKTTSFTAEHLSNVSTTYAINTTSGSSTVNESTAVFAHSTFRCPSTTTTSTARKAASLSTFTTGVAAEGKSSSGITIDYIPGPNPCEDFEGLLIVNRTPLADENQTSDDNRRNKRNKERQTNKRNSSQTSDNGRTNRTSEEEYTSLCSSSPLKGASGPRDLKRKKKRKLERSSRIDKDDDGTEDSSVVILQVGENEVDGMNTALPLTFTLSAPASLFGDLTCECDCHTVGSKGFPNSGLCTNCLHRHSCKEMKSKSLDETKIEPPSDFMSPAGSPSGNHFASISFPGTPHVWELPSEPKSFHHFHSDGESRWRGPEAMVHYQPTTAHHQQMDPHFYRLSHFGYHPRHMEYPNSHQSDPFHLRNMSKGDLWHIWQNSETEMRERLLRLEEERNLLASQLSRMYTKPPTGIGLQPRSYQRSSFERQQNLSSKCPPHHHHHHHMELEVPPAFRDTSSKDLRRSRYSRSLEEGRPYRPTKTSNQSYMLDMYKKLEQETRSREFIELCRNAKSLEDSQVDDSGARSEPQRKSEGRRYKYWKRRRDSENIPRRCKSSLDSRRSRSVAAGSGSSSDSSDSPKTETIATSGYLRHDSNVHRKVSEPYNPRATRQRGHQHRHSKDPYQQHLPSTSFFSDYAEKGYRKRKTKDGRIERAQYSSSLPRQKPSTGRTSGPSSYYSKSSSSDDNETFYGRRYTESSPLPLLQSLQKQSKQRKEQRRTENPTVVEGYKPPTTKRSHGNLPYKTDLQFPYATQPLREDPISYGGWRHNFHKTGHQPGRSNGRPSEELF